MKIPKLLNRYLLLLLIPLFSITALTACGDDDDNPVTPPESDPNLVELAQSDDNFSTLVSVIVDLGLAETLASGEFTVFAPTNAAFDALPEGLLGSLTDEQLTDIITFHVTEGSIPSSSLGASQDVESLQGEQLLVQASAAGVTVNGSSSVVDADLQASNGIIHAVDEVLLPSEFRDPSLVEVAQTDPEGRFTTLLDLVEQVGLTTTLQYLGPYTAFAPTNQAFDELFANVDPSSLTEEQITFILTYHVLLGETLSTDLAAEQAVATAAEEEIYITSDQDGVVVNGSSNVIQADIEEPSNGVIHVVDEVLLPNAFLNAVQVAQKNFNFTTLVDLIVQADLVDAVATSDITVFAPTNDAFATLFESVDPASLSNDQITEILLYHTILGAQVFAGDLSAEQTVESGSEESLYITADDNGVVVNGSSNVVTADVASTNGVIHAVDSVLLPNAFQDVTGIVSKNYDLTTLVGLLADNDLVTTLQGAGPFTVFAPTNQAFEDISDVLPTLTESQVVETLLYHVYGAEVFSDDLAATQTIEMLNEQNVTITVENETVTIEGEASTAIVTVANLGGTNGVVHIIDTVLIPSL